MASSTAARSLSHARKLGFIAEVLEKWQQTPWQRKPFIVAYVCRACAAIVVGTGSHPALKGPEPGPPSTCYGMKGYTELVTLDDYNKPVPGVRKDAWGIVDIGAVKIGFPGTFYIQSCAASGLAAHKKKIVEAEKTPDVVWGNRLEVWAWAKRGDAGKRKLWQLKRWQLTVSGVFTWSKIDPDDQLDSSF